MVWVVRSQRASLPVAHAATASSTTFFRQLNLSFLFHRSLLTFVVYHIDFCACHRSVYTTILPSTHHVWRSHERDSGSYGPRRVYVGWRPKAASPRQEHLNRAAEFEMTRSGNHSRTRFTGSIWQRTIPSKTRWMRFLSNMALKQGIFLLTHMQYLNQRLKTLAAWESGRTS